MYTLLYYNKDIFTLITIRNKNSSSCDNDFSESSVYEEYPSNDEASFTSDDDFQYSDASSEFEESDNNSDSSEDSEIYEEASTFFHKDAEKPVYDGARITVAESITAILSLLVSFPVSGVLLARILSIIELHCPRPNKCIKTLYYFKNFFKNFKNPLIRHFYCSYCFFKLEFEKSVCPNCKDKTKVSYFIEIPIISQLQSLYRRKGFFETVSSYRYTRKKQVQNNYEDIYDGSVYKKLEESFLSDKNNISFMWYTDGIPLFKSSAFAIWPVYLAINELPYKERFKKENIILAGLWFGNKKPVPYLFLRAFKESLEIIYRGITLKISNIKKILVRGLIICCTCDLPAKSLFYNMNQFNGYYGCPLCKLIGKRINNVHFFPFKNNLDLRTSSGTKEDASTADKTKKKKNGVKGHTLLSKTVHDFIAASAIDIMHCVFGGVTKKLMHLWFNKEFHNLKFSLRKNMKTIDEYLCSICPIIGTTRKPKTLDDVSHWKASEFKSFLLIYSLPILKNFMEKKYFEHHKLLVFAISVLTSESISDEDLENASKALIAYVRKFSNLYGRKYMTLNIHLLLHLILNVRKFGPLFTTSCFPF